MIKHSDTHHPECARPEGRWIPVPAAARRAGCSDDTIRRRIKAGIIAVRNPGFRQTEACPGCLDALAEHGLPNAA